MNKMKIALAVSQNYPNGYLDTPALIEALVASGFSPELKIWDDPAVDWAAFDIVHLHTPWDYHRKHTQFLAWCQWVAQHSRLVNSFPIVKWNSDKHYLLELQRKGIPLPVTQLFAKEDHHFTAKTHGLAASKTGVIVKPTIDATASNAHVFDSLDVALASDTVVQLHKKHDLLIQVFDPRVRQEGENSLVYIGGKLHFSIVRRPAQGDFRVQDDYGGTVEYIKATPAMAAFGQKVLDALDWQPAYARVDFIGQNDFKFIEIELIEPELFLRLSPEGCRALVQQFLK